MSKQISEQYKVPKGTRDMNPYQTTVRDLTIEKIISIFKTHGAVTIDTPVFELKETLTGKYGEESKLIYELDNQGGELCALRYDLTVPFARYLAINNIDKMKRYHIAKVYRRDNPSITKGRFREFYQCDFDIAGSYDSMLPDSECIIMMNNIYKSLNIGNFCIKFNHRKLLDGIFEICNVPTEKFNTICSSIDKLDKESWENVKKEIITKGLDETSTNRIGEYVQIKGNPKEILDKMKNDDVYANISARTAIQDIELLLKYLDYYGTDYSFLSFDMSLARGLDYYTGIIYETVLINNNNIGSIGGGGRYDNLVGIYGKKQIPCVGFSVGIERLFSILEDNAHKNNTIRESPTNVMIATIGKDMIEHRLKLANELWNENINSEILYKNDASIKQQLDYANNKGIQYAYIIGEDEIKQNKIKVKNLMTKEQETIDRTDAINFIKNKLSQNHNNDKDNNDNFINNMYKDLSNEIYKNIDSLKSLEHESMEWYTQYGELKANFRMLKALNNKIIMTDKSSMDEHVNTHNKICSDVSNML